jgi:hypothetical protein
MAIAVRHCHLTGTLVSEVSRRIPLYCGAAAATGQIEDLAAAMTERPPRCVRALSDAAASRIPPGERSQLILRRRPPGAFCALVRIRPSGLTHLK